MEESQLTIGQTHSSLIQLLGKPISETQLEDGRIVLRYKSQNPLRADYYHFKDNTLVYISLSRYDDQKSLDSYISYYGNPDGSLSETEQESQMTLHYWNEKGVAVSVRSTEANGKVTREYRFLPKTFQEYSKVVVAQYTVDVATYAPLPSSEISNGSIYASIVFIAAVIVIVVLMISIRRKRKKATVIH